jgi:hypothetical protein
MRHDWKNVYESRDFEIKANYERFLKTETAFDVCVRRALNM